MADDSQDKYHFLSQYLGAVINQDWDLDHGTIWDALAWFRDGPEESTKKTADLLAALRHEKPTESELASEFRRLQISYYPPGEEWTYAGWVEAAERYLRTGEKTDPRHPAA